MTTKEITFAENYLCTFNATEAAMKAGYSDRTARQIGYENLTKPYIVPERKLLIFSKKTNF